MTKSRIVVVEDEKDLRDVIVEELEDAGYEVAVAGNGKEGLDVIGSFRPNLILSDITMPVMNGYEMLKALREQYPGMRSVPIVYLSALADRSHIIEGKRLGVDDYLTKPVDFELLQVTVSARLREVERMTLQKEEQMLRLYTAMSQQPRENRAPDPALLVCDQWTDVSAIQKSLTEAGLPIVTLNRGSQLDAHLKDKSYSALIMTGQTDDMSANISVARSSLFATFTGPRFLFVEERGPPLPADLIAMFTKVQPIKNAASTLASVKLTHP